jgi:hypothetical protein
MEPIRTSFLIFLLLQVFINQTLSQWQIQNSGTRQTIRSISPIDSMRVWAVGDSGIILYTSDGGNKWEKQISNTTYGLNSVSFCDSLNGWAVGYGGITLNTTNGGKSWNRVLHDTADNIRNMKVKCFDTTNVLISRIAWYDDYYGGGVLWNWKSDSNGTRWENISPYSGSGFIFTVIDFDFISPNYGWVIKMDGLNFNWVPQVSKTTNAGYSWKSNQIPSTGNISFSDSVNGFLSSWFNFLYRYVDSSNTFVRIDSVGFYSGTGICSIGNFVYVNSNASIMKSTDRGFKWAKQIESGSVISDIRFISPEIGWAVGETGLILHTNNGGITKIKNYESHLYTFELHQNYPNPFNPTTTIKYDLSKHSLVKLVIFDMLGREIKTLVNEEKSAGRYSVEFNADNLSSGVYLYKLQSKEFTQTKKLILLR